jgi:hypothetical protein
MFWQQRDPIFSNHLDVRRPGVIASKSKGRFRREKQTIGFTGKSVTPNKLIIYNNE